jgi:hypothetical protein
MRMGKVSPPPRVTNAPRLVSAGSPRTFIAGPLASGRLWVQVVVPIQDIAGPCEAASTLTFVLAAAGDPLTTYDPAITLHPTS